LQLKKAISAVGAMEAGDGVRPALGADAPAAAEAGKSLCSALAASSERSAAIAKAATAVGVAAAEEYELLSRLGRARAPTLLLYSDADPACPVSQAHVAYHALSGSERGAQLVLYPGDTHALRVPAHKRDANRRVASWFNQHLAVEAPGKGAKPPSRSAGKPAAARSAQPPAAAKR